MWQMPLGSNNYTLKEERELKMIEERLTYEGGKWIARYPWIRDPDALPDNKAVVAAKLKSLENRLSKDATKAEAYRAQIGDMIERKAARKVEQKELAEYTGPVHYISHHPVLKPDSESTPLRLVFNSSASYRGHVLNEYWAKGPDLNNNLLGLLLRFRRERVALVGDIRKMYHSVGMALMDQHCHRFLWRDMQVERQPDTYCVTAVNFGDKPSATIAICALRETAEIGKGKFPEAADTILHNVHMDDVLDNVEDIEKAIERASQIDELLKAGNFAIKKWIISGEYDKIERVSKSVKVLGLNWQPVDDKLSVESEAVGVDIPEKLTKRICLSKMNSVFDPLGILSPVTIRAKMLLRRLWGLKLDWDTPIKESERRDWVELFQELQACETIQVPRCVKPVGVRHDVDPVLIMFSDASEKAMGAAAYIRYQMQDGRYSSRLIAAKSRVAPIEIASIVRLELGAAVLSARLAKTVTEEMYMKFQKIFYIVDSEIVRAMIQKQSYGFKTFAATRIGEIQQSSEPQDWWWVSGEMNVADVISRGAGPNILMERGVWQEGPDFLKLPVEEWPISQKCSSQEIPERVKVIMTADIGEISTNCIEVPMFSSLAKLLRVTVMVRRVFKRKSFRSVALKLTPSEIRDTEAFWVKEAQRPLIKLMEEKPNEFSKNYGSLGPRLRQDGLIVVGDRIKEHVYFSYNHEEVPLLTYYNAFTKLYARTIHDEGHNGVDTTMSKIRSKYWVVRLRRLVTSIRHNCVRCKRYEGRTVDQQMAPLPAQRLKPSPPWSFVGTDLFGPFVIKGEVQRRTRGKAYGVIFTCLVTRAVYLELAADYSTDSFLKAFRRFTSLRGYPKEVFSDCGTQLVAANESLRGFGIQHGVKWTFSTPEAPWQNGVTESLIKGVKKALFHVMGGQVLTFEELQTMLFEVANIMNGRPIGRHPTSPEDGSYLCPNDLLLGRASSDVPTRSLV